MAKAGSTYRAVLVPVGHEGGRYSMEQMTEVKWVTVQMGQRQFPF